MAHIVERQGMCRTLSRKDCRPGKGSCKVQYSTDRPLLHRGNSLQTDLFKGQHRTFSPAFFLSFLSCELHAVGQFATVDPDVTMVLILNCEGKWVSEGTEPI